MVNSPQPVPSDRSQLLLDFPIRFYTALRTIRLYPATNPQVQRSNVMVLQSFQELLHSGDEETVVLAVSDQRLLVCGEHLGDKDQTKPQIQGLINLFSRSKIHSLSFHPTLNTEECILLTQTLSALLAEREVSETVASMLDRAGIVSVTADAKRYVAIHEGEQVVRDELIGSGLNISDEELANFVLGGKNDGSTVQGVSRELVEELISRLPATADGTDDRQGSEAITSTVVELLQTFSREQDSQILAHEITQTGGALSSLNPALLAQLVANLPEGANTDAVLGATIDQLTPQRLNALIAKLVSQQPVPPSDTQGPRFSDLPPGELPAALQRLL
ncbi:MAG: hypothetical protein PHI97_05440, partial [Desulfobulbus sp.]|nr:hypothetical protein [Desulfobulbus sp.]